MLGNESDPDPRLELEATADAISDCGFPAVAKTLRVAAQLIQHREFYQGARTLLLDQLDSFRAAADMDDEACVLIVQVCAMLAFFLIFWLRVVVVDVGLLRGVSRC